MYSFSASGKLLCYCSIPFTYIEQLFLIKMSTAATINEFLSNLICKFTCFYCKGKLKNPKILPCLHSFCSGCLQRLHMESLGAERPVCPLCKAVIEEVKIDSLPSPIYLTRLQEMIRIKNNSPELACGSCDGGFSAVSYCFDCKCLACANCVKIHSRMKVMQSHQILELKNFSSKDLPTLLQVPMSCNREGHKNQMLELFCQDCERQVCQKCANVLHNEHNLVEISQASKESKKRILRVIEGLHDQILLCRTEIKRVDQSYKTVERRVIAARQEVLKKIEDLISLLRKHGDKMLAELESVYKDQQVALIKQRKELEVHINQIQKSYEYANEVFERDIGGEILDMERPIKQRFQQLISYKPKQVPNSQKSINVDYIPDPNILRTLQRSDMGKIFVSHTDPANSTAEGEQVTQHLTGTGERIEFVIHTKDSDHNPSYSEHDRVQVRIQSKQGLVVPTRIEDKKDGSYIASYTPLKTGIYQIDARVRGEPIRGSPFTVHVTTRAEYLKASRMSLENCVTNQEYKSLFSVSQVTCKDRTHLKRPCGIAIGPSDEVAVADSWNRRILLFNHRGKYITQFEGTDDLTNPVGVDFDFDGNIVVSDSDNQLIHVIDRCDVTIRTFGSEVLECPWGVCVTPKGRIAVCDWGSASVKEFSQQGKLIKEFSSGSTSKPYYIIHHSDKYFISFDSHCVEVFTADGEFLYTFGEKGTGEGQLRDPRGMTIDSKENLVVCDSGNHRLLVFTTDGRTYAVGSSGKAPGQFDKPQDAAFSSDGRLFVTDYSNNQVQILQKNTSTRSLKLSE